MKPIYPEVEIRNEEIECHFTTYLRMQDEHGTWYLQKITQSNLWKLEDMSQLKWENEKLRVLNRFHAKVYQARYTGKVDLGVVDADEQPVFTEDVEQMSEEDRVRMVYTTEGYAARRK